MLFTFFKMQLFKIKIRNSSELILLPRRRKRENCQWKGHNSLCSDSDMYILCSVLHTYCSTAVKEPPGMDVFQSNHVSFEKEMHLSFIAELVRWQIIIIFSVSNKMLQLIFLSDRRIEKLERKGTGASKL